MFCRDVERFALPNLLSHSAAIFTHCKITYDKTLRVLRVLNVCNRRHAALQLGKDYIIVTHTHDEISREIKFEFDVFVYATHLG